MNAMLLLIFEIITFSSSKFSHRRFICPIDRTRHAKNDTFSFIFRKEKIRFYLFLELAKANCEL